MIIKTVDIVGLLLVLSLIGAQLFSIDVGLLQLSAYRILLISSFIFLAVFGTKFVRLQHVVKQNPYMILLTIWITYSIIHGLWVQDTIEWLKGLIFLMGGYAISLLILIYISDLSKFIRVSRYIVLAGLLIGVLALNEIFNGDYYFLTDQNLEFYQNESIRDSSLNSRIPVVMFGNPNNYALFIYFTTILVFNLYLLEGKLFRRLVYLVILVFYILLLLATQSRSGMLGVGAFFGFYILSDAIKNGIVEFKKIITMLIAFILLIYYVFTSDGSGVFGFILFDADVGSDKVRINLILNGFEMLMDSYLFGVGIGNIEGGMNSPDLLYTWGITNIHNWWMELLVSSGILVFILYVNFYSKAILRFIKMSIILRNQIEARVHQVGFSFMISFVAASVGPSSLLPTEWFWSLFGLMMCIPNFKTID